MRYLLLILFVLIIFSMNSCRQKDNVHATTEIPLPPNEYAKGFKPDSSDLYAVLKLDTINAKVSGDKVNTASELSNTEIETIDSLIISAVKQHNQYLKNDSPFRIKALKNYRRQLELVVDTNGNKQVYVNAFMGWAFFEKSWKKQRVIIRDGGAIYFRLQIDLKYRKYHNFATNGLA